MFNKLSGGCPTKRAAAIFIPLCISKPQPVNAENKARAQYVHDALNKLTDDDCGDTGLGDLLLKETKYEMGDKAYDALSDEEKKEHADILTIISQANGKATLTMENLLTRAADDEEDTRLSQNQILAEQKVFNKHQLMNLE